MPLHRDGKGRPEWFNTLLNYSEPGNSPGLVIDNLGLDLDYSGGVVVAFADPSFNMEWNLGGKGNRICYAHFMREAVRKCLDVTPAGWVYRKKYLPDEKMTSQDDMDIN